MSSKYNTNPEFKARSKVASAAYYQANKAALYEKKRARILAARVPKVSFAAHPTALTVPVEYQIAPSKYVESMVPELLEIPIDLQIRFNTKHIDVGISLMASPAMKFAAWFELSPNTRTVYLSSVRNVLITVLPNLNRMNNPMDIVSCLINADCLWKLVRFLLETNDSPGATGTRAMFSCCCEAFITADMTASEVFETLTQWSIVLAYAEKLTKGSASERTKAHITPYLKESLDLPDKATSKDLCEMWDDWVDHAKKWREAIDIKTATPEVLRKCCMLYLFAFRPVARVEQWANLQVSLDMEPLSPESKVGNHIVKRDGQYEFWLNDFKNSGAREFELRLPLKLPFNLPRFTVDFDLYIQSLAGGKWLFPLHRDANVFATAMRELIKEVWGKPISCRSLRVLNITAVYTRDPGLVFRPAELRLMLDAHLHSDITITMSYVRN